MTQATILLLIQLLTQKVQFLEGELAQQNQTAQVNNPTEYINPPLESANIENNTPATTTYTGVWVCYAPYTGDSVQRTEPYECPSGIPMTMQDYLSKFVN